MTIICIVRHGETAWNKARRFQGREDTELNEEGKKQASLIAAHLRQSYWDVVVSSPLRRAKATAEIIRNSIGISSLSEDVAFIERDYGKGSGLTLEQQQAAFPDGIVPGKESDESLGKRVMEGLRSLAEEYGEKRIVLVTHGAVISALLRKISAHEISLEETSIKNACINVVEHNGSTWHVTTHNSVDYLGELPPS